MWRRVWRLGPPVVEVARPHDVYRNLAMAWRRQARTGALADRSRCSGRMAKSVLRQCALRPTGDR
ncbi:transposase [Bradyrhizobium sp. 136]|nr:transposase [Bradyrhizobium sp. 45]MCK1435074.1 transposase [Bradyrhizobium sp. 15]MCK1613551.1 transposase [Bradyrhizobium sp. 163]MCK1763140.1 transposase [Bradyrhizobium sp. 136]